MRCLRPTGGNFTLTFGTEHGQTFASDAAPSAEPEEEELAQVRLGAQEDKFAANIVDLALIATRTGARPRTDRVGPGHQQRQDRGGGNPQCGEA